jgi:glycosyltransferase involved in cell wall biosynthesis
MLEQIIERKSPASFRISRSACEACLNHASGNLLTGHPVMPSLLLQICEAGLMENQGSAASREENIRLQELFNSAVLTLAKQDNRRGTEPMPSCDVIVCAHESSERLQESIVSILEQEDVVPFVHLIDTGDASAVFSRFARHWNVRVHHREGETSALAALHSIIDSLSSSLVAIQSPCAISAPNRLVTAIRTLEATASDFFVSNCRKLIVPESEISDRDYHRLAHPGTLVFRRCSFVDIGGVSDVPDDDVELLFRARMEGRSVATCELPLVTFVTEERLPPASSPPVYHAGSGNVLRKYGKGFPEVPVACDVVLPFYGHLEFVEQALESLVQQQRCDLVIHLIDDASPQDTSEFLRKWSRCRNVRAYRNSENIGQFQSFNNACRYFETPLCAVQDADDISLPHRLHWSGQVLHYAGADIVGGAVELFGDDEVIRPMHQGPMELRQRQQRASLRRSFFPVRGTHGYFLENPTAMFRVSTFQSLGGFADFGDRMMNRASLDTEFQQRFLYHGVRFAISREIVLQYRVHPNSATQNTESGWGTAARNTSGRIVDARAAIFERGGFDPKSFGSLGRYQHLTQPLTTPHA